MAADDITIEARRFLAEHVSSVAQLELLLLLRTNPQRGWSAELLSQELRVEPSWASAQLEVLRDGGLIEGPQGDEALYCYQPRTEDLEHSVTAVAQAYLLHRVSVIEIIYSKPSENIRAFADAFRFRKDAPNG